ncbi:MAG TPA: FAD-dependent oxidoreductase [Actinocrinis sp.]|nr:FAD-dependent oxidoreductase [Actinocrinis sp.]
MAQILIIGGGIAGAASALALHKAGFEVVLHEAHPDTGQDIGAFLTLASNGMRALTQFDAGPAVARFGFPLTTMRVLDDAGSPAADVPLGEHDNPATAYRCLLRAELAATLRDEVRRRGITIQQGSRLVALREDEDGVTAEFSAGHSATGCLLIGADGLNSRTRALITPRAAAGGRPATASEARYAGQQVFYGYTTKAAPPTSPERITMIRSTYAAFGYAVSPAGETYWFARINGEAASAEDIAKGTAAEWRERLIPILRRADTPAADIVAATGDRLMLTNAWDLPPGIPWHTGRTVLLGDAAHAASPATGQGASMALEDAVVLAKAMRDAPDQASALAGYERVRRPRVEHNIVVSAQLTAGVSPSRPGPAFDPDRRGAQPGGGSGRPPVTHTDEELIDLLDWNTEFAF